MTSESNEAVETSATNVAMDQRTVVEEGQAIVDSIIYANDQNVIKEALGPTLAAWQTMLKTGNLNLIEVTDMGEKVLEMSRKSQIKLSDTAEANLENGLATFDKLLRQNKLTVDLVEGVSDRAFDTANKSLELIAEVKTGDFADLSKTVMLFALAALGLSLYATKGK